MSFKQDTNLADALQAMPPTAELILKSRPVKFNDETFEGFQDLLGESMRQVLNTYRGGNGFLNKMRKINPWTFRQTRAIANILMEQLRAQDGKTVAETAPPSGQTPAQAQTCGPVQPAVIPAALPRISASRPALPTFMPKLNIDLRSIPAGRFAVFVNGEWRFFIISEMKRRTILRGRFRWTKYPYANEYLDKGDRTVREQAGDTKKLIGKQKTSDPVYLGEKEGIIELISKNPAKAMVDYGRQKGACAFCGRSLTDAKSRSRGIGPDCWEHKYEPFLAARRGSMVTS